MDVFMTGATGFIGSAVAAAFSKQGHTITALAQNTTAGQALSARGYTVIPGTLTEPDGWQYAARESDVAIHAAHIRPGRRLSAKWLRQSIDARNQGLRAMMDAAAQSGRCQALIYTSGIVAHGNQGENWVDETVKNSNLSALGHYHLEGERMISDAVERTGLPAFSLRPGIVYGNGGTFASHFLAVAERGRFQYPGDGENYLSFVHIDDLAKAYTKAAAKPLAGETINIVDDEPIQLSQLAETLANGFPGCKTSSVPHWLVFLFAGKALADMLTASYRVANKRAKTVLDWAPEHRTLRGSIEVVISDYLNAQPA